MIPHFLSIFFFLDDFFKGLVRIIVPLDFEWNVGLNWLMVGVLKGRTVLYCCLINSWQFVAKNLKTAATFKSSFTEVLKSRTPRFLAKASDSSLKLILSFQSSAENNISTHNDTNAWSIRSILFWTKTVGISPHSFSTFFFQSLTASNEHRSVVLNVNTHAWAPR